MNALYRIAILIDRVDPLDPIGSLVMGLWVSDRPPPKWEPRWEEKGRDAAQSAWATCRNFPSMAALAGMLLGEEGLDTAEQVARRHDDNEIGAIEELRKKITPTMAMVRDYSRKMLPTQEKERDDRVIGKQAVGSVSKKIGNGPKSRHG